MNSASAKKHPLSSSPPRALRHRTLHSFPASLPSLPPSALNVAYVLAPTPSAATVNVTATTHSNAPNLLHAADAAKTTLRGTTPVPQQPVKHAAVSVHTLHHCVSTVADPMKHTQPPVPSARSENVPVKRMERMTRCTWLALLRSIGLDTRRLGHCPRNR